MAKKDTQEVEEAGTAVSTISNVGAIAAYDYGEDAGAGLEDVTQDEVLLPFLNILQALSPAADEDNPAHVAGAKKGMIINSVSQDIFPGDTGVLFVPVHREHKFVEWIPRDSGGGFVGSHDPTSPMVMEAKKGGAFGKLESPDGNDLIETFYVFGLVVDEEGGTFPAVISFSSSNIRPYKRWITQMRNIQIRTPDGRMIKAPMFAHVYRLGSQLRQNEKGSWYAWRINFAEPADPANGVSAADASRLGTDDPIYQAAREIRSLVTSDAVKVAYETADAGGDGEAEDDDVF